VGKSKIVRFVAGAGGPLLSDGLKVENYTKTLAVFVQREGKRNQRLDLSEDYGEKFGGGKRTVRQRDRNRKRIKSKKRLGRFTPLYGGRRGEIHYDNLKKGRRGTDAKELERFTSPLKNAWTQDGGNVRRKD